MATIKLSRAQWELIGSKTGWNKKAKSADPQKKECNECHGKKFVEKKIKNLGTLEYVTHLESCETCNGKGYTTKEDQDSYLHSIGVAPCPHECSHKTAQNLEVVKTPEKLTDRETTRAVRDAIIAEEGAIKQYESVVDASDNKDVKRVLQSVSDEERVHVGELQKLLSMLLPDEQEKLDEGAKEVEK